MVAANGVDGRLIDELTGFGGTVGARSELFPVDLHAGGINNAARGGWHFRADAFPGDQRDFMSHACIVLYGTAIFLSEVRAGGLVERNPSLCGENGVLL